MLINNINNQDFNFEKLTETNKVQNDISEVDLSFYSSIIEEGKKKSKLKIDNFEYKPVDIEKFIDDPYYLDLKDSIRPAIKQDLLTIFDNKPFQWDFKKVIYCEGIGTGKTFRSSIMMSYVSHCLLCLYSPAQYFGNAKGKEIALINMSVNAQNAKKNLYEPTFNRIIASPWFQDHYLPNPDKESIIEFDKPPKDKKYDKNRIYKNISILPGCSNPKMMAGYDVFLLIIDEATLYNRTAVSDDAEDIYNTGDTRIVSRFGNNGMLVMAGSPQYAGDFLQRKEIQLRENAIIIKGSNKLTEEQKKLAKTKEKNVLIVKRALWDAKIYDPKNGHFYFDHQSYVCYDSKELVLKYNKGIIPEHVIKVPMELYEDFKTKPLESKRDLAGIPLETLRPIFGDSIHLIKENCNMDRENPVIEELLSPEEIFYEDFTNLDKDGNIINEDTLYAVHCDLGISNDAACMSMGHIPGLDENNDPIAVVDFIYRYKPTAKRNFIIAQTREMIYELTKRGFNIALITYDGFQSADAIQILSGKGYNAETLSIDKNIIPYSLFVDYIIGNRLDYPNHPIFIREAEQLEFNATGTKIDHPPTGSKDATDAVCGVLFNLNKILKEMGSDMF